MAKRVTRTIRYSNVEWDRISQRAIHMGLTPSEWVHNVTVDALDHPQDHYQFPRGRMERKLFEMMLSSYDLLKIITEQYSNGDALIEQARQRTKKNLARVPVEPIAPYYMTDGDVPDDEDLPNEDGGDQVH